MPSIKGSIALILSAVVVIPQKCAYLCHVTFCK
uniref:Uncharacterized protein n=1 Tax=Arundo donax TaxID=35708 RepID=A0A0A8YIR7_ARUDO